MTQNIVGLLHIKLTLPGLTNRPVFGAQRGGGASNTANDSVAA